MNRSEFLFAAIDVLFHPFQNYKRYKNLITQKNVPYHDADPAQTGDIIYRASEQPLPVVLNIHGGGFVKGDKKHRVSISEMYADKGWFVYNINYRLSPKHVFPAAVEDCVLAANYLAELKDRYNLDLSRFVVTGDSAGAYLSSYLVALASNPDLHEKIGVPELKVKPTALLSYCGPYDVITALQTKLPFGLTHNIAVSYSGQNFSKDFSDMKSYRYAHEISPMNFVNADWCPTMLTYAQKDIFCAGQGELLHQKLSDLGVPVCEAHSTTLIDNHCYHFNFWTKTSKQTMAAAFDFLDKVKNRVFDQN